VVYKENKKIKDRTFRDELEFRKGQRIKPDLIAKSIRSIQNLYDEKGYLNAVVSAELTIPENISADASTSEKNTRNLIFTIKENKKVKTRRIIFDGNSAFSDLRLRRVLSETKQQRWYLFWRPSFDEEKFEEDKLALTGFYRNRGYRDFNILSDSVYFDDSGKRLYLQINVHEGPRYKYRNFTWDGQSLFTRDILESALGLEKGDFFSEEDLNLAVLEKVQSLYLDKGYIYSQIEPQITPAGEDSLDIHFVIIENHQVKVRNIYVYGNTKTRENVIRRELKIYPGDIFNRKTLQRSVRDLFVLNFFENVVPDVSRVNEDEVDLEFTVAEKPTDEITASVGITGAYGMEGGGSVNMKNFRGLGQQFGIFFKVGSQYSVYNQDPGKYQSFSLRFVDPMIFDSPNRIGFSLSYSYRGSATQYYFPLDILVRGGSIEWGRRFKWPDDYFSGYWIFRTQKKDYQGTDEDLETYLNGITSTVGLNITQVLSRNSHDRAEFPTRGSKLSLVSTLSGGILGGNEDFHKHVLNLEWYTPTFWKFVLMSSFKMGVIRPMGSSGDEVSIVPFDEKFIMGGNGIPYGTMLRGYRDNAVGPRTSSGSPLGGSAMLKFTSEFRIPISESPVVYGLAFAEMGNVWDDQNMSEPYYLDRSGALDLKRSVGVGIRFFMPMIGMLGFDYGYGFDDADGDGNKEGWMATIIFGQGNY
jgi:outer membrane protein insertion porin family